MKIEKSLIATTTGKPLTPAKAKEAELEQKDAIVLSSGAGEAAPTPSKEEIMQLKSQTEPKKAGLFKSAAMSSKESGDAMGRVIGSAFGMGGAVGGAYLGTLGGAATMGLLGLGAGVPGAILAGKDGLSIIGSAFGAGGTLAKIGIVVGTACGAVGGYYIGSKLGYLTGFAPAAALSYPVGLVGAAVHGGKEEIPEDKKLKEPVRKRTKAEKVASSLVGGVGVISGAAGGAAIGGVIASGAALTAGLVAKDVALSAITSTGLIGAGIGAAAGAVLLGVGGYKIIDMGGDLLHSIARGAAKGKEKVELDMKEKELDKKMTGLQEKDKEVQGKRKEAEIYFTDQFAALDAAKQQEDVHVAKSEAQLKENEAKMDQHVVDKNKEFDGIMASVAQKTEKQDGIAQERADKRLDNLKATEENKYQTRKKGIEDFNKSMDARDKECDRIDREIDIIVDKQSDERRDKTAAQMEAKFQSDKAVVDNKEKGLEQRQDTLDKKKVDMPNLIHAEGTKHLDKRESELKSDLAGVEAGLQKDLDAHKSQLKSEYDSQAREYNSQYTGRKGTLDREYNDKNTQVGYIESNVQSLQKDVDRKKVQIRDTEARASQKEAEANSLLMKTTSDKNRYEQEASTARAEAGRLQGQLSTAQGTLSSTQRRVDQARSDYQRTATEMNQVQGEINSLNNQIANLMK